MYHYCLEEECSELVLVIINVTVEKDYSEQAKDYFEQDKELKKKSLMPPHPLTIFEIIDYFKNEPRFNGVSSRDNLPKTIKNGAYVISLDEYQDTGTHWIALFIRE